MESGAKGSIREMLLDQMREGVFAAAERLPAESALAGLLGISRTQLRDSLGSLEREGYISRRQGVGTVINRHVLQVSTRMDLETEFMDMVRNAGHQPSLGGVSQERLACDDRIALRLGIAPGAQVLKVARVVMADDCPAIYCEDYIDCGKIKDSSINQESLTVPIFHFLRKYCGLEAVMDITRLHPVTADAGLARILAVAEGAPLLYMDEVDYDIEGRPVFCSAQYYVDGIIEHSVLRKKL